MSDLIDRFIVLDDEKNTLATARRAAVEAEAAMLARLDLHVWDAPANRPSWSEIRAARKAADDARRALLACADEMAEIRAATPDLDRLVSERHAATGVK